ncbi:MAG TPA: ribonuclease HII [Candidatus Acidoferrales bacterium]|nr:ribonuclease HII [Candidatus Acidoferrales bacterium]
MASNAKSQEAGKSVLSKAAAKLRLLKRLKCTTRHENALLAAGARHIAGVDEVGRGCLFGPVVAAACVLDPGYRIRGLRDSKLLKQEEREALYVRIREHAVCYSVAAVAVATIDAINIRQASLLAMKHAVAGLSLRPCHLLVDAERVDCDIPQTALIHGDAISASIAAASILAKVERDAIVCQWHKMYPQYDLASNKGYSTPKHKEALRFYGPTPQHRQSFAPVWMASAQQTLAFDEVDAVDEEAVLELEAETVAE